MAFENANIDPREVDAALRAYTYGGFNFPSDMLTFIEAHGDSLVVRIFDPFTECTQRHVINIGASAYNVLFVARQAARAAMVGRMQHLTSAIMTMTIDPALRMTEGDNGP